MENVSTLDFDYLNNIIKLDPLNPSVIKILQTVLNEIYNS